jgi:hypothetical protein
MCELLHTAARNLRATLMAGNEQNSPGSEMKALVATIALLCMSSSVLAHDIYSDLRDRDGHLCCGGEDCKPVQATVLPNGKYYLPATNEIISADKATPSPDDRFHQCTYYPMANEFDRGGPVFEDEPKTRCFFAPMHSS